MHPANINTLPSGSKRTRRVRSIQGNVGADPKKGKGNAANTSVYHMQNHNNGHSGTAAIFLVKTYEMISTCDENLAAWSDDGDTFVVKDPDQFAKQIIPNYFDHSKFSSFSRQLNFYGFKKVPSKNIRSSEYTKQTSKYVRFYNEKFKRGREDLLCQIHRSTKGSGNGNNQVQDIKELKDRVSYLENKLTDMTQAFHSLEAQIDHILSNQNYKIKSGHPTGYSGSSENNHDYQRMETHHDTNTLRSGEGDTYSSNSEQGKWHHGNQNNYQSPQDYGGSRKIIPSKEATLAPHPNMKKEINPTLLPPPPDSSQLRAASLLRGFSSEFTNYEARLFENLMTEPTGSSDVNEISNIRNFQGLQISRAQTSTEELPPVERVLNNA